MPPLGQTEPDVAKQWCEVVSQHSTRPVIIGHVRWQSKLIEHVAMHMPASVPVLPLSWPRSIIDIMPESVPVMPLSWPGPMSVPVAPSGRPESRPASRRGVELSPRAPQAARTRPRRRAAEVK